MACLTHDIASCRTVSTAARQAGAQRPPQEGRVIDECAPANAPRIAQHREGPLETDARCLDGGNGPRAIGQWPSSDLYANLFRLVEARISASDPGEPTRLGHF
jgi:hypothetical protein